MLAEIVKFYLAEQNWLVGCEGYSIISFYNGSGM